MEFENEVIETEVDESVNEEVADLEETETEVAEESVENQEVAEPEPQSAEQNSVYASIRRKAEADAQKAMDRKIANLCKDVTHPVTGKPITTFAEYEDAIAAQNRMQAEEQLRENGVDVSILDNYVNSSPVLARANEIIAQNEQARAEAQIRADFEELQKLNSDLKTFGDIENIDAVIERMQNGTSLVDAYKIVNFDVLMSKGTKSAHQQALNQAKGKSHLEPTESVSESSDDNISETMLQTLKMNFPDKTEKEIRKLYKQTFK